MTFKPPAKLPDFSDLVVSLDNTKLQQSNYALYQTIFLLIQRVIQMQNILSDDASVAKDVSKADIITHTNETALLPNSRELTAGESVSLNKNPTGRITINVGRPWGIDAAEGDESGGGSGPPGMAGSAGSAGAPGPTGAQGNSGPPGIDGYDAETLEPIVFPGLKGDTGPTGGTGPAGAIGSQVVLFDGADGEDSYIPGPAGINGATGATGANGAQGTIGPYGFDGEDGEPSYIPGPTGPQGPTGGSGSGGLTVTDFTQDLGSGGDRAGTFDITGLAGLTIDKDVLVIQTAQKIASKGDARDEFEMDPIHLTGYVVDAATIRVYWNCNNPVVGTYAFAYAVSG